MRLYFILLSGLLRRVLRSRDDLLMENLVLRQQLAVYARRPKRPRLQDADRLFWQRWRELGDHGVRTCNSCAPRPS